MKYQVRKVILSLCLLLSLSAAPAQPNAAQRDKAKPVFVDLTAAQREQWRADVESRIQAEYEKIVPGITVQVFLRGAEFVVLFRHKSDKRSVVVKLIDVSDEEHPLEKLAGVITAPRNAARKGNKR